ncbi:MAG: hypothetical protein R3D25_06630 [Geminicoccaceae bacterium]
MTPYLDEIQAPIVANYRAAGFDCVARRHLLDRGNYSFALYSETLRSPRSSARWRRRWPTPSRSSAQFRGTRLARSLEQELGIPIYDTVATAVWQGLRLTGVDPARVTGWGRVFAKSGDEERAARKVSRFKVRSGLR